MFTSLKDKGLATVVRPVLNGALRSRLKGAAVMLDLDIDSQNKRITCSVGLAGETEPIKVTVHEYEIVNEDGDAYLRFGGIETSREWMTVLVQTIMPSRRISIPPRYAGLIKLAL